eukprot:XP_017950389.1 PREDICTED: zinc finger protein 704 [Xenopus tropicalis]
MQARRLSKRSVLGSKVNTSEDAQDWGMKGARKRLGMGAVIQEGAEKQRANDKEEVAVEQQRATCDGEESVHCSLKNKLARQNEGRMTLKVQYVPPNIKVLKDVFKCIQMLESKTQDLENCYRIPLLLSLTIKTSKKCLVAMHTASDPIKMNQAYPVGTSLRASQSDKEAVLRKQKERSLTLDKEGTRKNNKFVPSTNQYMERHTGHIASEKPITYQAKERKEAEFVKCNSGKVLKRAQDMNGECTSSFSLLEQKCKVVSSSIDVPHARIFEGEADMDKVTAAMVLTSLSTSPLVRSPPMRLTEWLYGSWKESGFVPSSTSSSGCWSWNTPSDCSNPSTPSPPLSADSFRYFQPLNYTDENNEDADPSSILFDEPVPRKRKNSMKVMFKCLWKTCEKVLSTSAGIKKHIRTIHLGHTGESDENEGEEDFYYTEIRLNTDAVSEGLRHLSPFSQSLQSPTFDKGKREPMFAKTATKSNSSLSRSAPSTSCLRNLDHAYQTTAPVKIPGSKKVLTNGNSIGVSWILSPVTFTGTSVSLPSYTEIRESKLPVQTVLPSPPKTGIGVSCKPVIRKKNWKLLDITKTTPNQILKHVCTSSNTMQKSSFGYMAPAIAIINTLFFSLSARKPRGEGKKCRKVYGMENRDKWCTACRWKKACQRFPD